MSVKVTYNSPVILTLTIISFFVLITSVYFVDLSSYLGLAARFDWTSPFSYLNLVTYTMVHATSVTPGQSDFGHFIANFTIILLIGPVLEEKYGGKNLVIMMLITAIVTGFLNVLISNSGLIGSSGLALMMIILSSFTNYRKGDLPMTFIIICIFFLGNEVVGSFRNDNVSQFAHIIGGIIGAVFGFRYNDPIK